MTPTQIAAKPADTRTPIEQAILEIHNETTLGIHFAANAAYRISLGRLQALLPFEREQIERAYQDGWENGNSIAYNEAVTFENAADYFTQTYNTL